MAGIVTYTVAAKDGTFKVEYWYDRSTRCWWAHKVTPTDDQIGAATHAYRRDQILSDVKDFLEGKL